MKKIPAIFLAVVYACFITGSLWVAPAFEPSAYERCIEGNGSEKNETEPGKEIEVPHFIRVHKTLPGKIKIPRTADFFFTSKKYLANSYFKTRRPVISPDNLLVNHIPLFLKNSVFRI